MVVSTKNNHQNGHVVHPCGWKCVRLHEGYWILPALLLLAAGSANYSLVLSSLAGLAGDFYV
eukprot:1154329-Pelagomonas_calceolata.AAC.2